MSIGNRKISEDVRIYKPSLDGVRRYQEDFRGRRRGKISIGSGRYLVLVTAGHFTKRTRVTSRAERIIVLL